MRIAVPYENGSIFQHFGRTAAFKLYDAEDGEVRRVCRAVTDGSGHGALVGFLRDKGVDALICGGIGGRCADGAGAGRHPALRRRVRRRGRGRARAARRQARL